jgi:hypothetical protein
VHVAVLDAFHQILEESGEIAVSHHIREWFGSGRNGNWAMAFAEPGVAGTNNALERRNKDLKEYCTR